MKKIYRYEKFEQKRISTLLEGKIFLSRPSSFNDLKDCNLDGIYYKTHNFDLLKEAVQLLHGKRISRVFNAAKKILESFDEEERFLGMFILDSQFHDFLNILRENTFVSSFSEKINNQMMGYYADSHNGFCVEYEVDLENLSGLHPVVYVSRELPISIDELVLCPDQVFTKILITKTKEWAHEKEWRFIVYDESVNLGTEGKIISLPEGITPKRIILGDKIEIEKVDQLKMLGLEVIRCRNVPGFL